MGIFSEVYLKENGVVPQKRKFTVHAKDEHGKNYKYEEERYSPRGIHKSERFVSHPDSKPHKLISIHHDGKDVTNESYVPVMEDRSEYSANAHLSTAADKTKQHHVFIKKQNVRKSIAGPFHSKEEAESHPSRKFGDGVCTGAMCEDYEPDPKILTPVVIQEATTFNKVNAIPGSHVRLQSDHKEHMSKLGQGERTNDAHHLVTHYSGKEGHTGTSHFVTAHRDGDAVHLRDKYSGKHIATVAHADL